MPNFVDDALPLPYPKSDLNVLQIGDDPTQHVTGAEWNLVNQSLADVGNWLRAAPYYGLDANIADPMPGVLVDQYLWMRDDGAVLAHKPDTTTVELLPADRSVIAGAGLDGGGDFTVGDVTIDHADSVVAANTYPMPTSLDTDQFGHIVAIVSGGPGTFDITDAANATVLDALTIKRLGAAAPANGLGVSMRMVGMRPGFPPEEFDYGLLTAVSTDLSFGTEKTRVVVQAVTGGSLQDVIYLGPDDVQSFLPFVTTDLTSSGDFAHTNSAGLFGVFGVAPAAQVAAYTQTYAGLSRTLNDYTADDESTPYVGIDNAQGGTPYANITDLEALRTAYENLRASFDNVIDVFNQTITDQKTYGFYQ